MQTSVNITSVTSGNKKVTKSLLNINPEISNTTLKEAAQLFTAISKNSYVDGTRINKIGLNEEYEPEIEKIEPTLTVDNSGVITYNGDGQLFSKSAGENANFIYLNITNNQITAKNAAGNPSTSYSGIIYASEGENYAAKSVEFTVGG